MSKIDFFCIRNTTYLPVHDTCLKSLSKNISVVSRRQFVAGVATDLQKTNFMTYSCVEYTLSLVRIKSQLSASLDIQAEFSSKTSLWMFYRQCSVQVQQQCIME